MSSTHSKTKVVRFGKTSRMVIALTTSVGLLAGSAVAVQAPWGQGPMSTYEKVSVAKEPRLVSDTDGRNADWRGDWRSFGRSYLNGPFSERRGRFANMTDEEVEERISRIVRHVAIEIDATPEQVDHIIARVTPTALEIRSMRGNLRETRQEFGELLLAPVVDRTAIEELRAEKLAEADKISEELVSAFADVASILNAEQREELRALAERFRSRRDRKHRR